MGYSDQHNTKESDNKQDDVISDDLREQTDNLTSDITKKEEQELYKKAQKRLKQIEKQLQSMFKRRELTARNKAITMIQQLFSEGFQLEDTQTDSKTGKEITKSVTVNDVANMNTEQIIEIVILLQQELEQMIT